MIWWWFRYWVAQVTACPNKAIWSEVSSSISICITNGNKYIMIFKWIWFANHIASFHPLHHCQPSFLSCCPSARRCAPNYFGNNNNHLDAGLCIKNEISLESHMCTSSTLRYIIRTVPATMLRPSEKIWARPLFRESRRLLAGGLEGLEGVWEAGGKAALVRVR